MRTSKRKIWSICIAAIVAIAVSGQAFSQTTAVRPSPRNRDSGTHWSVQVDRVEAGDRDVPNEFQVAIYENLVEELNKTKQFTQVLRERDRRASEDPNLLILKTTVVRYTPGSETRRAVTTVSGATKLMVRSQLVTREGRIVLERTVNGNVRFFGNNLRATHNLARNIAKAIKQSNVAMARAWYRDTQPPTLNADGTQWSDGSVTMCSRQRGRP